MGPRTPIIDPFLLKLQKELFSEAAERQALFSQQVRRRSSLRSARPASLGDVTHPSKSPTHTEKSLLKPAQSPSKRQGLSQTSPRQVVFATELTESINCLPEVKAPTERKSSVSKDIEEISNRKASLRSSSSGILPKQSISENVPEIASHFQQPAALKILRGPRLRNPYPNKRRTSLRSHTHYHNHYQYNIPIIPLPTPYLHRCSRANCSARFLSRGKLHTHIRDTHGYVPLEWMRKDKGVGKEEGTALADRLNCHICGKACADTRRLSSHVSKSHGAKRSVEDEVKKKTKGEKGRQMIVLDD
jgi:hypothetical protein